MTNRHDTMTAVYEYTRESTLPSNVEGTRFQGSASTRKDALQACEDDAGAPLDWFPKGPTVWIARFNNEIYTVTARS